MKQRPTIAFVTPWYGPNVPGGAESEARHTAEHLAAAGLRVEVLTTTIRDFYADWSRNARSAGVEEINGVVVRRFPVERRDKPAFDRVNQKIIARQPLTDAEEAIFMEEFIRVPKLIAHIRQSRQNHLFFFIPYLFPTTFWGVMAAPERSVVIPCLHDEGYAHLDLLKAVLPKARALVFHSQAEADLAAQLYGAARPGQTRVVMGEGLAVERSGDPDRFRREHRIADRFILYAGRRTPGKNVHRLLDQWRHFKRSTRYDTKLVLIGPGRLDVTIPRPVKNDVIDLGYLSEQGKWDSMAAADLMVNPSLNESFSLMLFEGWVAERPALVNGQCAVTVEHVRRAGGGLYYNSTDEFIACIKWFYQNRLDAARMGRLGRRYVLDNFDWPTITGRYIDLIDRLSGEGQS